MSKKETDIDHESDGLEASPEFDETMEEMSEDFFEESDPEFAELLKRVKGNVKQEANSGD